MFYQSMYELHDMSAYEGATLSAYRRWSGHVYHEQTDEDIQMQIAWSVQAGCQFNAKRNRFDPPARDGKPIPEGCYLRQYSAVWRRLGTGEVVQGRQK